MVGGIEFNHFVITAKCGLILQRINVQFCEHKHIAYCKSFVIMKCFRLLESLSGVWESFLIPIPTKRIFYNQLKLLKFILKTIHK